MDLEYIEEYLPCIRKDVACDWCKHPTKFIYRAGLCRHCYDIRARVNKLRKKVQQTGQSGSNTISGDLASFQYRVAMAMQQSARTEGEYCRAPVDHISGIDLEHQLSFFGKQLVHEDLYRGYAGVFDRSFTPSQKQLIHYLFSLMNRAYRRKTRWRQAAMSVVTYAGERRTA